MKPFGMRAMMSLRLEKGFGSWGREFRPDYMAGETGMDRFISWKKNTDFIGRAAAEKERADGPARKALHLHRRKQSNRHERRAMSRAMSQFSLTEKSSALSHPAALPITRRKSVAIGFLPIELANEGQEAEIEILGEMRKAVVYTRAIWLIPMARGCGVS